MKRFFRHIKQSGFTLVEMITAFAILGVSVVAIGGLFVTGVRSYSSDHAETALQQDGQLALNQIESMLIDSTLGVDYNVVIGSETSANYHFVESDTDSSISGQTPVSKVLYVFNSDTTSATGCTCLLLKWYAADKCLYYKEVTAATTGSVNTIDISGDKSNGWDLLAEHVDSFSLDLSKYDPDNQSYLVYVDLIMKNERYNKTCKVSATVYLRNNVLINEMDLAALSERNRQLINSEIQGVELTASTYTTTPGSNVQLRATVTGIGYVNQNIYRWFVSTDDAGNDIIYDSLQSYASGNEPTTVIDVNTRLLKISSEEDRHLVYVWVQVDTGKTETDESGATVEKYVYAYKPIAIKTVSTVSMTPTAKVTAANNNNFNTTEAVDDIENGIRTWAAATLTNASSESDAESNSLILEVMPGNVINMNPSVKIRNNTEEEDGQYAISVSDADDGVLATVTSSGVLTINSASQEGSFYVKLVSDLGNEVIYYKVVVGEYDASQNLVIEGDTTLNRGGQVECTLKLGGIAQDPKDYDWSVEVVSSSNQTPSGDPVNVSETGVVSASTELSFDYSFNVTVSVYLKSNPDIKTSKVITIPRVSLIMTPSILFSQVGKTIESGTLSCVAVGLEEYNFTWKIARETNPSDYETSFATTGTWISESGKSPEIQIGSKEPSSVTYLRAKATLEGYSNYTATCKINLGALTLYASASPSSISRGSSTTLTARVDTSITDIGFNQSDVEWSILSIYDGSNKVGASDLENYMSGITFGESSASGCTMSVASGYQSSGNNIIIQVQASWNGVDADPVWVTVTAVKPQLNIIGTPYRGNTIQLQVTGVPNATVSSYTFECRYYNGYGNHYSVLETALSADSNGYVNIDWDFWCPYADVDLVVYVTAHGNFADVTNNFTIPAVGISVSSTGTEGEYQYSLTNLKLPSNQKVSWSISYYRNSRYGSTVSYSKYNASIAASSSDVTKAVVSTTSSTGYDYYVRASLPGAYADYVSNGYIGENVGYAVTEGSGSGTSGETSDITNLKTPSEDMFKQSNGHEVEKTDGRYGSITYRWAYYRKSYSGESVTYIRYRKEQEQMGGNGGKWSEVTGTTTYYCYTSDHIWYIYDNGSWKLNSDGSGSAPDWWDSSWYR